MKNTKKKTIKRIKTERRTKILANIGELQLLREAHIQHIQNINGEMDKLKNQLVAVEQKGEKDGAV